MLEKPAQIQMDMNLMQTRVENMTLMQSFLIGSVFVCLAAVAHAGETMSFDLSLVDGKVAGDPGSIRVTQNDQVVIRWQADRKTEIHLHGYDVKAVLAAEGVTEMQFHAHATGRYPLTSHGHHGDDHDEPVLIHIEVYPE